jgi:ribonuclease BN (tRNA processing enzyme)
MAYFQENHGSEMRLTVLGTGCPIPEANRAQSGYLLEKSGRLVLVDCGSGIQSQLAHLKVDWARLDTFLLTHHHLDHMSDLLPILTARWLMGFPAASVYGPEGTRELVPALIKLFPYVHEHVSLETHDLSAGKEYSVAGFNLATCPLRHYITSLAYKFDEALVICGDSVPVPELRDFVRGCKLLIHECSHADGNTDLGHTTPSALGRALAGAQLDRLLLTHFYPGVTSAEASLVRAVRACFHGRVELAYDLQEIEL